MSTEPSQDRADERRKATEELARVRAELEVAERPWLGLARVGRIALVLLVVNTALASGWTCVVTGMAGADPLFGAHADLLCPRICEGCVGPYGHDATTTIEGNAARTDALYCADPEGGRHAVPGGIWFAAVTMMAAAVPVSVLIVAFLSVAGHRGHVARRNSRRRAVERAEQKLEGLG